MTMPHLMNCGHSDEGWCLDCVKAMHDALSKKPHDGGPAFPASGSMDQSKTKTKTIYRMSFEKVEVRPDGSETVVRRIMDQINGEDDPSGDIGCLIGLIINSICNADDPWAELIFVAAIQRVHNLSNPFIDLADAYRDWEGNEDFEDFVEVRRLKEARRKQGGDA